MVPALGAALVLLLVVEARPPSAVLEVGLELVGGLEGAEVLDLGASVVVSTAGVAMSRGAVKAKHSKINGHSNYFIAVVLS